MSSDLIQLRKNIRRQRRQLSIFQQRRAEHAVLQQLLQHPKFKKARRIGLYLDAFGEIRTRKIIQACFAQGKSVFLPKICTMSQCLLWVKISAHQFYNARFNMHRLGMLEPMHQRGRHVAQLDFLIMPLVLCDCSGHRVGMGGGYYDRTLASAAQAPYRMGLAHEFQYIHRSLARQSWDQSLDALLTPKQIHDFKRR